MRARLELLALVLVLVAPIPALADPPKGLQDAGDCGIEASQKNTFKSKDDTYEAVSFFEPGRKVSVGRITDEDVRALDKEVTRLKANKCYSVCVRSLVAAKGLDQAAANCDLVFIAAHGEKGKPYIALGGNQNLKSWPTTVNASSVWIGACFAQENVKELNGASGSKYSTMPKNQFDNDCTASLQAIVQGLTEALSKLKDTECEKPKKVCVLSGVQAVVKK